MEKHLILYRAKMTIGKQMASSTPEEMKAGMEAWLAWGAAAGDALVDWGAHHAHIPGRPGTGRMDRRILSRAG